MWRTARVVGKKFSAHVNEFIVLVFNDAVWKSGFPTQYVKPKVPFLAILPLPALPVVRCPGYFGQHIIRHATEFV
jgi:hypothetical protein